MNGCGQNYYHAGLTTNKDLDSTSIPVVIIK